MYTTRYDTRADWIDRKSRSADSAVELREATPEEIADASSEASDRSQASLISADGSMALLKVERGARYGGTTVGEDYVLFVLFFTRELSRTRCE